MDVWPILIVVLIVVALSVAQRSSRRAKRDMSLELRIDAPQLSFFSPKPMALNAAPAAASETTPYEDRERALLEFVRIAAKHHVPLELCYRSENGRGQKNETVDPCLEDGGFIAVKEGRISARQVITCYVSAEVGGLPQSCVAFVRELAESPLSRVREQAVLASYRLSREERIETLQRLASDEADYVRGFVADATRSFTVRTERTVNGKRYKFLGDQAPELFSMLTIFASDQARVVRQKAAYALGDNPSNEALALLDSLLEDPVEKVREGAAHAKDRLAGQREVRGASNKQSQRRRRQNES